VEVVTRKTFLTIVSFVASAIGALALTAPGTLIEDVKHAPPSDTANVMARTVGVLILTMGVLNFLVRSHEDSPTLRAVLIANLVLQVGIMPVDPLAYFNGVYGTFGSFVPNTILHIVLAGGFSYYLARMGHGRECVLDGTASSES
jgi:hypothetical protein